MKSNELFEVFKTNQIDAIISESPQTRKWYSNVSTTDGWLIIEPKKATLFVDGRYIEYATKNAKNVKVELLNDDSLKKWFSQKKFNKVGIEEDYLTIQNKNKIKNIIGIKESSLVLINGQKLRIKKTKEEIDKIQKAIDISLDSFDTLMPFLKEGITEKEIQHKLEYIMVRKGAEKEAFDSIIAFGESTAEPHHHSSDRKLKKGDMVTIDFGAKYDGYCADITRTFIFDDQGNAKYKEILSVVEEAANLGRQAVKPGVKTSEIDKICRSYIASKGYSKFFLHSTGHGLGIDVHEFPYVSPKSDIILEEGMVITIEPGIYIEGIGGARIEDDVLVTENGSKVLTRK
ncbi:MAG: aminopeptidase P family protein [Mycoplasma sp.]|nr:aminopeptidase P family protein [Mycoplasma sp.]